MPDKLRLEDAEEWAAHWESFGFYPSRIPTLRALIDLARAAKREVRCTCRWVDGLGHADDCPAETCPDTAAELGRWE